MSQIKFCSLIIIMFFIFSLLESALQASDDAFELNKITAPSAVQVWYPNGYAYIPAGGTESSPTRIVAMDSPTYSARFDLASPKMESFTDLRSGVNIFAPGQAGLEIQVMDSSGTLYNSARRIPLGKDEIATALRMREGGPVYYWCHINNIRLASESGVRAPVTAELMLYCWKDRINCDARIISATTTTIKSANVRLALSSSVFTKIADGAGVETGFGADKTWSNSVQGLTFTGNAASPTFTMIFPDKGGLSNVKTGSLGNGAYLDINIAGSKITPSMPLSCACQMMLSPDAATSRKTINAECAPLTADQIQLTGSSSRRASFANPPYDPKLGCYNMTIPWAHGWEHYFANPNDYESAKVKITGDSFARAIKLRIYRDHAGLQEGTQWTCQWAGFVATDAKGNPTEMPFQGANIYYGPTNTIEMNWVGHTEFALAAGETRSFEAKILPDSWGRHPVIRNSSEDLLVYDPYGQLWLNTTGSRGGGNCSSPLIQNVIPSINDQTSFDAPSNNCGGGELIKYQVGDVWHKMDRGRLQFVKNGNNLFHIAVDNMTDDGAVAIRYESLIVPATDINRQLYRFHAKVLKKVSIGNLASNLRLFTMGDDRYAAFPNYASFTFTNAGGKVETRAMGAHTGIPLQKNPGAWVVETGATEGSGARGFILRKFDVTLSGQPVHPAITVQPSDVDGKRARVILTTDSPVTSLNPGDRFDIEVMLEFYGTPSSDYTTMQAEAAAYGPAGVTVAMTSGTLVENFPVHVKLDGKGVAGFAVTGGKNWLPIIIDNFSGYVDAKGNGPILEEFVDNCWQRVNQEIHGNDFWQIDKDPTTGRYSATFLILTEGNARRFRAGFGAGLAADDSTTPRYRAQFQPGDIIPIGLDPARYTTISLTVKNTGTADWTGGKVRLKGLQELEKANQWHDIPSGVTVKPGKSHIFTWQTITPAVAGFYLSKWRMCDGDTPFGTPVIRDTRIPSRSDNALWISQEFPKAMPKGQSAQVSVTVKNVGNTTWKGSAPGPTEFLQMPDSPFQGMGNILPSSVTVAPGGTYEFKFQITAPAQPGTYKLKMRLIHQGIAWFGPVITQDIRVQEADRGKGGITHPDR